MQAGVSSHVIVNGTGAEGIIFEPVANIGAHSLGVTDLSFIILVISGKLVRLFRL